MGLINCHRKMVKVMAPGILKIILCFHRLSQSWVYGMEE